VDQNIPLGPVDRRQPLRRHWLRRRRSPPPRLFDRSLALGLLGALLALTGLWLSSQAPRVQVGMDARAYTIQGARLPAIGPGTYAGAGGVVVVRQSQGSFAAAASATLNGAHMVGRCAGSERAGRERCSFRLGATRLTATDTWNGGSWARRYDDGRQVDLEVTQRLPVPVPVALGA
jgi:hypothetical protein